MRLTGEHFVGRERVRSREFFRAINPATAQSLEPGFGEADHALVGRACELAESAFEPYRNLAVDARARFLEEIGEQIMALGDELLARAHAESALPLARLTGERARTVGQLRLFAEEIRSQRWLGVRVDPALPERKPLPRPDLRQRRIPLGPVAVFGASNFPLAFSVAGGDTAAALAAGCPVVVKSHPAHPGTSELVASAVAAAVEKCGLPSGVFALLHGRSNELGAGLVADPRIKAVAFTGSRAGGVALMRIANARPEPIPVYAEMSSINPVLLLPGALRERAEQLARDFVASLTLGVGQFCTNPGLVIARDGPDVDRFIAAAGDALRAVSPAVMLTAGIQAAYEAGVARLLSDRRATCVARAPEIAGANLGQAALFVVQARDVSNSGDLTDEIFGPASIVVRCASDDEMIELIKGFEGQLTATLHLSAHDHSLAAQLIPLLERKAGRLIANGWPTGVEVAHAMVHGGPFPATSDGRSTSVGTLSIDRFLRPVCYQDFPETLLPDELRVRD